MVKGLVPRKLAPESQAERRDVSRPDQGTSFWSLSAFAIMFLLTAGLVAAPDQPIHDAICSGVRALATLPLGA